MGWTWITVNGGIFKCGLSKNKNSYFILLKTKRRSSCMRKRIFLNQTIHWNSVTTINVMNGVVCIIRMERMDRKCSCILRVNFYSQIIPPPLLHSMKHNCIRWIVVWFHAVSLKCQHFPWNSNSYFQIIVGTQFAYFPFQELHRFIFTRSFAKWYIR